MRGHKRVEHMLARRRELTPAERAELDQHLAVCADCRATADAYAEQNVVLRTMPLATPPPALRARVLAAVHAPAPSTRSWTRFIPALSVASAAVLVAVVILFAWAHRPQEGSNTALPRTSTPITNVAPATPRRGGTTRPGISHPGQHPGQKVHGGTHRKSSAHRGGSRAARPGIGGPEAPVGTPPSFNGSSAPLIAAAPPPPTAVPAPFAVSSSSDGGTQSTTSTPQPLATPRTGGTDRPAALHRRPTATAAPTEPPHVAVGASTLPTPTAPPRPPATVGGSEHPSPPPSTPLPMTPLPSTTSPDSSGPALAFTHASTPTPLPLPLPAAPVAPPPPVITPTP